MDNKRLVCRHVNTFDTLIKNCRLKPILQATELFGSLDVEEFTYILAAMVECKVPAGTNVICEGTIGDAVYLVEKGSMQCTKSIDGREKPVGAVSRGETMPTSCPNHVKTIPLWDG